MLVIAPTSIAALLALAAAPVPAAPEAETPGPMGIVGGEQVAACQFPSVVSILEDDETPVLCTGSLIHPQVVMTAAHCIIPERPIIGVGFGEHGQATGTPERLVPTVECVPNPAYASEGGADVGYCILSEPVDDVPIVPLMAGCEVEQLTPGREVVIIGFGADAGFYDPETDELTTTGVGTKRWTTQTVEFIDDTFEEINLVGPNGSQSACFGDSGGPGMVQLDDGTWRVFGTGGHLYDPGGLPPPEIPDNICGAGAAYGFAPFVLDWLEQETALDLTPCWDGNTWTAGPACADFPVDPQVGNGVWGTGCGGGSFATSEPPACADVPPPPPPPDDSGDETTGETTGDLPPGESTGDDGLGQTTGGPVDPATTGPVPPLPETDGDSGPQPPDPPGPLPGGTGSGSDGSSGGGAPGAGDDGMVGRGCDCRTSTTPPRGGGGGSLLWLLLVGLGLRPTRRRA